MTLARLLSALALAALARGPARTVEDFRLLDQDGRSRHLYALSDQAAVVLIARDDSCPSFRDSLPAIRELERRFGPRKTRFLFLDAVARGPREALAARAAADGLAGPVLLDESQMISRALELTRAGEALVVDPKGWRLAYRGSVEAGSGPRLEEAIGAVVAGREPAASTAAAGGCPIAYEPAGAPTYVRDVAPLLVKKCMICHYRDEGPAPFTDYRKVSGWAPMMRETIRTGRMPPNAADLHVGEFENNPALTPAQTRTLLTWLESELPRGEGPDPLALAARSLTAWPQGRPDMVFPVAIPDKPVDATLYKEIELEAKTSEDLWIRNYVIEFSRYPKILQHTMIAVIPEVVVFPRFEGEVAYFLPASYLSAYANFSPILLPWNSESAANASQFVPKGSRLVLQIYYTSEAAAGKGEALQAKVGLYRDRRPNRSELLRSLVIGTQKLSIPPGEAAFTLVSTRAVHHDISVHGLFFDMHHRGLSAKITARYPNGASEDLFSVPLEDYHSHHIYRLKQPKEIPAGSTIAVEFAFDNSPENDNNPDPSRWVHYGVKWEDEMDMGVLYYTDSKDRGLP